MPEVVVMAGLLISGVSLYLFARPGSMRGLLDKVFGTRWLYAAALFRLLLGAALIAVADTVAYPRAVALFGWLFVLGGLTIVVIPAPALRPRLAPTLIPRRKLRISSTVRSSASRFSISAYATT